MSRQPTGEECERARAWLRDEEKDCGHRQPWSGRTGWQCCDHPFDVHPTPLRWGGFAGSDFVSLGLDGNCLCKDCRRKLALGLLPEGYRHVCARCALDRLLAGERKDWS